jgi:hypothetical protein
LSISQLSGGFRGMRILDASFVSIDFFSEEAATIVSTLGVDGLGPIYHGNRRNR